MVNISNPPSVPVFGADFNEQHTRQAAWFRESMLAVKDGLQTSPADTTAGRFLTVGSFGLGSSIALSGSQNLKDRGLPAGFYTYLSADTPGGPDSASFGHSLIVNQIPGASAKTFISTRFSVSAPRSWIGQQSGATGAIVWRQIYDQASVLGTVSQTGGLPTGAVIERGSNGNGKYVRFADGTQICTAKVLADLTDADDGFTGPYPASFISNPSVSWGINGATLGMNPVEYSAARSGFILGSPTSWRFRSNGSGVSTAYPITLTAIGDWF